MGKLIDLTGQQFGRLTVIERGVGTANNGNAIWICRCECGKYTTVAGNALRRKNNPTKSCGCLRKEIGKRSIKDLTGQTFGRWTVLYLTEERQRQRAVWHCKCLCGTEKNINAEDLLKGRSLSCGCVKSIGEQNIIKILVENNIEFEREKKFEDLVSPQDNKTLLRFDFYLPTFNRLIEFDGVQHYSFEFKGNWGDKDSIQRLQERDIIKNKYALLKNIDLVRIPYWERDKITLEMILGNSYLINKEQDKIYD